MADNKLVKSAYPPRNLYIDCLKGVLIILVVLGHSIQFGGGTRLLELGLWKENPVFLFIYTFHMPLFMAVSGWVLGMKSVREGSLFLKGKRRFLQIVVPALVVAFLLDLYLTIEEGRSVVWSAITAINRYSFLTTLFFLTMTVFIIESQRKAVWAGYVAVMLLFALTPSGVGIFSTFFVGFLGPYFIASYLLSKYKDQWYPLFAKYEWEIVIGCVFIFAILFPKFHSDNLVYFTEIGFWRTTLELSSVDIFQNNLYRYLMGILGSVVVVSLFYRAYNRWMKNGRLETLLVVVGQNSLGIYMFDNVIHELFLCHYPEKEFSITLSNQILQTVLMLVVCLLLIFLLKKNKWAAMCFLGILPKK